MWHKGLLDKATQHSGQRDHQEEISLGQQRTWSRDPRARITLICDTIGGHARAFGQCYAQPARITVA